MSLTLRIGSAAACWTWKQVSQNDDDDHQHSEEEDDYDEDDEEEKHDEDYEEEDDDEEDDGDSDDDLIYCSLNYIKVYSSSSFICINVCLYRCTL